MYNSTGVSFFQLVRKKLTVNFIVFSSLMVLGLSLLAVNLSGKSTPEETSKIPPNADNSQSVELISAYTERLSKKTVNIGAWLKADSETTTEYTQLFQQGVSKLNKVEKQFKGYVSAGWSRGGVYSSTVGIFRDDTPVFTTNRGLNHQSVRSLASVSKVFTAVAVAQLAEKGLISLDDDIKKYFPKLPHARKPLGGVPITVRDVMRHSSGIPYRGSGGGSFTAPVRKIRYYLPGQTRPAGTGYRYSNQGYYLLGALIEKVTGVSYPEYIQKNIMNKVGMPNSNVSQRANAASGVRSSVDELYLFYRNLMHPEKKGALLSRSTLDQMLAMPPYIKVKKNMTYMGLGLKVRYRNLKPAEIYHNGMWHRMSARLGYFINEDSYLVFLTDPNNFRSGRYQGFHGYTAHLADKYIRILDNLLEGTDS